MRFHNVFFFLFRHKPICVCCEIVDTPETLCALARGQTRRVRCRAGNQQTGHNAMLAISVSSKTLAFRARATGNAHLPFCVTPHHPTLMHKEGLDMERQETKGGGGGGVGGPFLLWPQGRGENAKMRLLEEHPNWDEGGEEKTNAPQ